VTAGRAVLLLAPSRGLGGGIERYVETLEWAFAAKNVPCRRVNLEQARVDGHIRMVSDGHAQLRAGTGHTRVVVAHRALLPVGVVLARNEHVDGISVVCHGNDVWGRRHLVRRGVEDFLMRRPDVRVVAVSSFTAGALLRNAPAGVLSPGLSGTWFETLVEASVASGHMRVEDKGARIVTAFRLSQWRDKGLPEIMRAVEFIKRPGIGVIVCGSGVVPDDLKVFLKGHPGCAIRQDLPDREFARELAAADLFVLATRTRRGRRASGEGFGLVLLEAQVAGTPVVAPAYAGSHDAHLDAVTGVTPVDETAESLAKTLDQLLRDRWQLEQMGKQAAEWARACFAPELYASRVVGRLL
jgi:phosphatidylinositol alpha-1,6-mannosyltransferase